MMMGFGFFNAQQQVRHHFSCRTVATLEQKVLIPSVNVLLGRAVREDQAKRRKAKKVPKSKSGRGFS